MFGKYIRIISVLFFLFASQIVMGQNEDNPFSIIESVNDSIDLHSNFYDETDSLSEFFPASNLYETWDTDGIHYPKVDFSQKKDTTILVLIDNKTNFYSHPKNGRVTSEFGYRRRRFHYGIDIGLNIGDSVKSAFDGMVRIAKYHKGYGNVIVIRHFNGLETVYGHLSVSLVKENQLVKAGTLVGYGGSTGRSTGPHLLFEVRYLGTPMNPRKVIDFEHYKLLSDTLLITNHTFDKVRMGPGTTVTQANNTTNRTTYTTPRPSTGVKYHYVRKGQTLGHIAGIYHTTVSNLCKLNRLTSKSVLQIGQKIRVK